MRGLNLSRIARTSESSFFKNEQVTQAARLRERLADRDPSLLKISSPSPPCPDAANSRAASADVLMEIAAHGVYRRLAQNAPKPRVVKMGGSVPRDISATTLLPPLATRGTRRSNVTPDANVLRALGPARLSVYEQISKNAHRVRALPGSDMYAEGVTLGMVSFCVATMIVASVGLVGGIVLYTRPGIIESWRVNTVKSSVWLDDAIGKRLRRLSEIVSQKSHQVVTDEKRSHASAFARSITKRRSHGDTPSRQD